MVTQGNSIDEAVALITAGNAINQDPEKVGNGLRTIALRMAGTEEAKKELEESGEEVTDYIVDGVVGTKSKIDAQLREFTAVASNNFQGVSMIDAKGNYKDTYEVMQDIADIYDEIEETDKKFGTNHLQALLELLAGKNRANIAASILQNGEMLRSVYESSQDSEGSAMEENEKYLDSIEGKVQKLQNNLQNLAFSILNSDLLKTGLDVVNGLLDGVNAVIDAIGGIPVAMGAAFAGFKFVDWLRGNSKKAIAKEQGKYIQEIRDALVPNEEAVTNQEDTITEQELAGAKAENATASEVEASATASNVSAKEAEIATNEALAQSERDLATARKEETATDVADNVDDAIDNVDIDVDKNIGKNIGKEVADDISDNATQEIEKATEKAITESTEDGISKAASEVVVEAGTEGLVEKFAGDIGKNMDDGADAIKDGVKKATSEALKDGTEEAAEEVAKSGILSKIIGKLSGSALGLGGSLALGGSILGVGLLASYTNWVSKDYSRKFDKSTNSDAEYTNTVSDLESIDTKIAETQEKIKSIQDMPTLSITDEADLDRLKRENVALERQKSLLEAQERTQKEQRDKDAKTALESKHVEGGVSGKAYYQAGVGMRSTKHRGKLTDMAREEVDEWIRLQGELSKYEDEFMQMDEKEQNSQAGKNLVEKIEQAKKDINTLDKDYIQSHISQLTDLQSRLDTTTKSGLEQYNTIDEIINKYNEYGMTNAEKASSALTSFFGGSTDENISEIGKNIKQNIIDQLSSGQAKNAQEALNNLGLTLSDIGDNVDADSLNDYFGNIVAGAKMAKESIDAIDGSFSGVQSAFSKANQGADFDEMANYIKTAQELYNNGQIGTDDFKSVVQWMSPEEITGNASAYKKAYKKYIDKVNSWFNVQDESGNVDVKKGITNFAEALTDKNLGKMGKGLDSLKLDFENTATAAKKLGVSTDVVDLALHKLEEYGVDVSKVNFSSDMLKEYSSSLDSLKATYDSMTEGEAKKNLGELIFGNADDGTKGLQGQLEYYQDHLDELTEDKIVQIKLEVDEAELESSIDTLRSGNTDLTREQRASVIAQEVSLRGTREKSTGITKNNNTNYASSYKQISDLHELMRKNPDNEKAIANWQKQEDAIIHLQNSWLDLKEQGKDIDWNEFIKSDEAKKELEGLESLTDEKVAHVLDTLRKEAEASESLQKRRDAFINKDSEYRFSHKEEAEGLVAEYKAQGYEDAGINNRGRVVKDVEASNKRIEKSTKGLFKQLSEGKDVYGELEKEAKRHNLTSDEESSAVEKLANKYKIGTKALKNYEKQHKETKKEDKKGKEQDGKETKETKEVQTKETKEVQTKETKETKETNEITNVDFKVDTSEIDNLDEKLNLDEVQQKVVELVGVDNATPIIDLWNSMRANPQFASLSAKDQATQVIERWNNMTPEQKEAFVKGNNSDALNKIQQVDAKKIKDKIFNIVANGASAALNVISGIKGALRGLRDKSINIITHKKTITDVGTPRKKISGNQEGNLFGTAHTSGTAYAKGTLTDEQVDNMSLSNSWRTQRTNTAITGEVGQELVVDGNQWFTVGDRGAEFARIPKGAIVFNAEQTEQLFKKGYINSRGKSNGKVNYPSSSASFAKGTAYKKGTKTTKKSKSKSSNTLADKISNYVGQLFDWAELRLKRLSRLTDKYSKIADKANKLNAKSTKQTIATYGKKNRKVKTVDMGMQEATDFEIRSLRNEIVGTDVSRRKYLSASKRVAKKGKLSKSLQKQVRNQTTNGTFNIKYYKKATKNKATLEAIEAYNTWYEKYLDTQNTIIDLEKKMKDAYQKRLDNIESWYSSIADYNSAILSRDESRRKYYETSGTAYNRSSYDIATAQADVNNALSAYNAYSDEINRQIKKGVLKSGTSEWYEAQSNLAKLSKEYYDSKTALEEMNQEIRSMTFDKLKTSIDILSTSVEKLSSYFEFMDKIGIRSGGFGYDDNAKINNINTQINQSKQEIPYWIQYRNEALADMSTADVTTEKWEKAKERFDEANSSILDISSNIVELAKNIREIRWKPFEDGMATLDNTEEELSNMRNLLNDEYFRDENGILTKEGLANIGLLGKQIENAKKRILGYNQAIVELEDDYRNQNITLDEYIEKKREYQKTTQQLAADERDYVKEIVSVYTESIKEQNDALQENIEKRKQALDRVKDYYDYQRTISEKSKDINYLEQQIRALEGVSNKAGEAKLAALRDQLAEAQIDMNDTVYEHEYSLRVEGYDRLAESLDESLNEMEKKIARSTEYQRQIVEEALSQVKANYTDISDFINNRLAEDGVQISNETKTIVSDIGGVNTELTDMNSIIKGLNANISSMITALSGIADIDTSKIKAINDELIRNANIAGNTSQDNTSSNTPTTGGGNTGGGNTGGGSNTTTTTTASQPTVLQTLKEQKTNLLNQYDVAKKQQDQAYAKLVQAKKAKASAAKIKQLQATYNNMKNQVANLKAQYQAVDKEYDLEYTKQFIANNKQKGDANKYNQKGYSDVNQKLYSKTNGYVLSTENMQKLAYGLGLTYNNASSTGELYKRLQEIKYFARGSQYIPQDMFGITQDKGQEVIYRKSDGAMLTPLGKGDKVFTAQMTDNLWKLAKGLNFDNNGLSDISNPIINNISTNSPTINITFDSFMTVEGNVDKNTIVDIRKFKSEMVEEFTRTMTNEMNLLGHKHRF